MYVRANMAHAHILACMYESPIASQSHLTISTLKIIVAQSLYGILFFNGPQTEHTNRSISSIRLGRLHLSFLLFFPLSRLTSRDGVYDAIKFDS